MDSAEVDSGKESAVDFAIDSMEEFFVEGSVEDSGGGFGDDSRKIFSVVDSGEDSGVDCGVDTAEKTSVQDYGEDAGVDSGFGVEYVDFSFVFQCFLVGRIGQCNFH